MQIQKLPLVGYIYASFFLNILTAITIAISRNNLPPVVPLLYGRPIGTEQLIPTLGLFIAPASATLITFADIFLASYLNDDFLKRILAISSFFVSLLATITVGKIILLVGFW